MTESSNRSGGKEVDKSESAVGAGEDKSGRNRLLSNVLSSWLGYLVFVVGGFVMPRLIHDQVGQFMLGIWDLSWSVVNYLALANLGLGSAINRYVAKYRTVNDVTALCSSVSSVMLIQLVISLCVLAGAVGAVVLLPAFFADVLGEHVNEARLVVGLLGASLAVQLGLDAFRGVLTGCHRWDLHNSIQAGSYAVTTTFMATSLYLGGGLGHLAAIYLVGTIVGEITRARAALRVCPELRISFKASSWAEGKKMVRFGGNTILVGMPPFILVQTTNVLVASALGPAALAVFSRPLVLLRHLEAFLNKFSYVLTPMAGSLQSSGQDEDIRRLFVQSTRIGVAMTLPAVLILLVFGDVILNVWMGPEYAHIELIATFALGYFLPVAQSTGLRVLVGLNRHGRIGVWSVSVSLLVLVAGVIVLNMTEWSLVRAALLITLPLMLTQGIVTPVVACRMLKIPLSDYLRRVFLAPGLCGSVFASVLLGARILIPDAGLAALAVGIALGAAILAVLYWRYVLTPEQRVRLGKRLPVLRAASARGKA